MSNDERYKALLTSGDLCYTKLPKYPCELVKQGMHSRISDLVSIAQMVPYIERFQAHITRPDSVLKCITKRVHQFKKFISYDSLRMMPSHIHSTSLPSRSHLQFGKMAIRTNYHMENEWRYSFRYLGGYPSLLLERCWSTAAYNSDIKYKSPFSVCSLLNEFRKVWKRQTFKSRCNM